MTNPSGLDDDPVSTHSSRVTSSGLRTGGWGVSGDAAALLALSVLLALVIANRSHFDGWVAGFDLLTQYIPWYAYLGDRLRSFHIPGWNPYQFSGTPFAGDPQSGWMYLPAMLSFVLLPPLAAFKTMVALQLVVGALSTYALARVLQMGSAAALVAATCYACGPFLAWGTGGVANMAQLAAWIPLGLLGVELTVSARTSSHRLFAWFVGGFAVSQMLAGWLGQGAMYGLLVVASYIGYRALLAPPVSVPSWRERLWIAITGGLAVLGLGLALGAAGFWPRLVVNTESTLAGGTYRNLGQSGATYPPMDLPTLLSRLLADDQPHRTTAWGGAVIILVLLTLVFAGRRYATPYFVGLTLAGLILTQAPTPLHRLLYLLPRFQDLHEHDPGLALVVVPIGTALLSGATVAAVARRAGTTPRRWWLWLVVVAILVAATAAIVSQRVAFVGWRSLVAAALTLVVVTVALVLPGTAQLRSRLTALTPLLLLTLIVAQPTGLELTGSWLGWPPHPSWTPIWEADPAREAALAANVRRRDPGGAGEYLQRQLANDGPFRYVGYSGFSYPGDEARRRSYMTRRFDPHVTAILVNGRPLFLGLYDIQGYNPIQMSRYREFITALNGKESNYHIAYLLPSGAGSPLLKLLDVRYVVIDASLPDDREDVLSLRAGRHLVFRNDLVAVYEDTTPSHAWIVHDVRPVTRGEALPLLTGGTIDLSRTALIEGATPLVEPATGAESARVTHYSPEAITIATSATAPGLLVVSEVYAAGWRAIVDGEPTSILPTNHVLRGIPIPAGQHVVELRYELPALQVGLLISTAAWVALLLALVNQGMRWGKQRRRKSRDA